MKNSILHLLAGTWFVVQSNFPLWLKGDKTHPTFNYTLAPEKGKHVLLDEVRYEKKGKIKTITGFDRQDAANENKFVWKGKGLLFIAKSRWEVKLMNEEQGWAVIHFSKTLFTPEGVDIISRKKELPETVRVQIKNSMEKDSILRKHIGSLKMIGSL